MVNIKIQNGFSFDFLRLCFSNTYLIPTMFTVTHCVQDHMIPVYVLYDKNEES